MRGGETSSTLESGLDSRDWCTGVLGDSEDDDSTMKDLSLEREDDPEALIEALDSLADWSATLDGAGSGADGGGEGLALVTEIKHNG